MALIRSRDTGPELALRRALYALGLRYRLHKAGLPGRPDIVLARFRTVIFVHGCFWHRHSGCKVASTPKSNTAFWEAKFERNTQRDTDNQKALKEAGWDVVVVWECEVRSIELADGVAREIALALTRHHRPTVER